MILGGRLRRPRHAGILPHRSHSVPWAAPAQASPAWAMFNVQWTGAIYGVPQFPRQHLPRALLGRVCRYTRDHAASERGDRQHHHKERPRVSASAEQGVQFTCDATHSSQLPAQYASEKEEESPSVPNFARVSRGASGVWQGRGGLGPHCGEGCREAEYSQS